MRRLTQALLLSALAITGLLARSDESRAAIVPPPQIFLSWHAPWGYPGATDTLMADCDTTRSDTLWLSFDPEKTSPLFLGIRATLKIRPAVGDSLSSWWTKDRGKGKPTFVGIGLEPSPGFGYPMPYVENGGGGTQYDEDGPASVLRIIYATRYDRAVPIAHKVYAFARLVLRRPPSSQQRCNQSVCIEWADSEISFDTGASRSFVSEGPHRFVSLNSPGGEVSWPYRKAARLQTWKPGHP